MRTERTGQRTRAKPPLLALAISRFNGFAVLSNMNYLYVEKCGLCASAGLRIGA